ncbi:hypothetical protein [Mesobacillus foraminis]|nr:hypothetical protein [Mesobacillus foraminis]
MSQLTPILLQNLVND